MALPLQVVRQRPSPPRYIAPRLSARRSAAPTSLTSAADDCALFSLLAPPASPRPHRRLAAPSPLRLPDRQPAVPFLGRLFRLHGRRRGIGVCQCVIGRAGPRSRGSAGRLRAACPPRLRFARWPRVSPACPCPPRADLGAAYGTAKAGVGIASMGIMHPSQVRAPPPLSDAARCTPAAAAPRRAAAPCPAPPPRRRSCATLCRLSWPAFWASTA